ncbi:MAG: hypothetical protein IPP30_04960 [Flavobacterium sp.]|nr:hypothetical protein [Flavobacterium sp.]
MRTRQRILLVILFFLLQSTYAQVLLETVYVSRPKTAKVVPAVRYYYYPNLQAYYDTCIGKYLYIKEGEWITADFLPSNYRGYCIYNNNYVLLYGFTEDEPYTFINDHKKKYPANFSSKRRKDNPVVQK